MSNGTTNLGIYVRANTAQARAALVEFQKDIRTLFRQLNERGRTSVGGVPLSQITAQLQQLQAQQVAGQQAITQSIQQTTKAAADGNRARTLMHGKAIEENVKRLQGLGIASPIDIKNQVVAAANRKKQLDDLKLEAYLTDQVNAARARGIKNITIGTKSSSEFAALGHYGPTIPVTPTQDKRITEKGGEAYLQKLAGGTDVLIHKQSTLKEMMATTANMMKSQISWFAGAGAIFAVVGGITAAAKATLEFYQNLKNIQAVTGESDAGIRKISAAALEVAKNTPIAASEASKLGLTLIQAGLNSEQAAEAMKTVAAVTTVSGEDMVTVSKAVTTAMFSWHKSAKDIPDIGNSIAAALNFSRLTVTDLGTAFNYLASTSSIMGRSLNETVSIMATLSNAGIRASTIGTGMSQLFTQLLVPTKNFSAELARMGISANAVNPQMNKFADIVELLQSKGFSAAKAMHLLGDRAGREMAAAMVMGADAFREMEGKIEKSKQLQEGLAKAMEGPINSMKNLRNQIEVSAIQIGAVGVPAFNLFISVIKIASSVLVTMTSGVSFLADNLGGGLTAVLAGGSIAVLGLARNMKSLILFLRGATTAQAAFNLSVLANPYVRMAAVITTALVSVGLAVRVLKKDNEDIAGTYNAVKSAEEAKTKRNLEMAESTKIAEAAFTSLKEAWDSAGKAEVTLSFAQGMFEASLETAKLEDNLIRIKDALANAEKEAAKFNETNKDLTLTLFGQTFSLEHLKKGIIETKGFWANFFKDARFLPKSWTEKQEPALSPEEQWIKDTNESFQRAMAELAERDKALLEQSKKREISKALKLDPRVMARQTVAGAQAIKDMTLEEQTKAGEQKIADLFEKAQKRLAAADRAERGMTAATTPADREKILKEADAALVNWRAQGDAAERLADIIQKIKDAGANKLAEQTERYRNSVEEARREVERLNEELADIVEKDPLARMESQATKAANALYALQDKNLSAIKKLSEDGVAKDEEAAINKLREYNDLLQQQITSLSIIYALKRAEKEAEFQGAARRYLEGVKPRKTKKPDDTPLVYADDWSLPFGFDKVMEQYKTLEQLNEDHNTAIKAQNGEAAKINMQIKEQEFQKNLQIASATTGAFSTMFGSLYQMEVNKANADGKITAGEEKRMRRMFELQKTASIAQALVSTYTAAAAAWSPIGGAGPIGGGALSALIIAAGLASVAAIESQQFGGGGGGGGGGASGGGGGASYGSYYEFESKERGTGWRPNEGQGAGMVYPYQSNNKAASSTNITYNIVANDSKSFAQMVKDNPSSIHEVVQQDIKDNGNTKKVIQQYI